MKAISVLILSTFAGAATFGAQQYLAPAQLHAAPFTVPSTADWRQQMIDHDPGGAVVDRMMGHLTDALDLSAHQVSELRPLFERQHEQILKLLLTSSPTLTRDQFTSRRQAIIDQTHRQVDVLLSEEQRELAKQMRVRRAG